VDVKLIAHTQLPYDALSLGTGEDDYKDGIFIDPVKNWMLGDMELDPDATDMDTLAEYAGRGCYLSFNKPNESTRANKDYLANIIKQGHFNVMRHGSFTLYVTGVSRSLSHQLVTHTFLETSQESQRYVNQESSSYVVPPVSRDNEGELDLLREAWEAAQELYTEYLERLEKRGITGKKATQAARSVLPNMTATSFTVSSNLQGWRSFLQQRLSPAADAEIQEFARRVLVIAKEVAPACFQDFEVPNVG